MSDSYVIPEAPSFRSRPLAHILSRVVTLSFLSHADGHIRSIGCDWFELMRSENLNYRIRQALVRLVQDAGQIKACRQLHRQDRRAAKQRAMRASQPRQHVAYGSACPACGRASLTHGGHCTGGLIRHHQPHRRRGSLVTYVD